MIERPTPARVGVVHAGDEAGEAANAAPVLPTSAAPEAEQTTHVLAASGPDPALAPPAPPRFADRHSPPFESTTSRPAARRASRRGPGIEGMNYRVIFACCMEATDTPIK